MSGGGFGTSWTGWCPVCYGGPYTLERDRVMPRHLCEGRLCAGINARAITFERAKAGIRGVLYGD